MTRSSKYYSHYYGWFVATLLAIALATVMLVDPQSIGARYCTVDAPNCVREWVSALSGWAALLAAWVTIQTMNRHQRESLELQIRPQLATATAADQAIFQVLDRAKRTKTLFEKAPEAPTYNDDLYFLERACKEIEDAVNGPFLSDYRRTIGIFADSHLAIDQHIEICRSHAAHFREAVECGAHQIQLTGHWSQIASGLAIIEGQFESWLQQTREFKTRWWERIR
ncbi:hypothetical protein ASD02_01780 [Ensifer sp. Root1252]|nr:hypothetical protein ASD02_01780 [Ensifer sp. Root1252]KRC83697.1 hypothetical protein ASE32_01770 [Ensifer sp. Root231]KRD04050.1 hypothetical protein ASE47_00430 [Ensifer sp. Root258]